MATREETLSPSLQSLICRDAEEIIPQTLETSATTDVVSSDA